MTLQSRPWLFGALCTGIDDVAPDSDEDGCIERDADGRPTGLLFEKADLMEALTTANVDDTADYISDALQVTQR